MLQQYNILAGNPKLNYLTLPTVLTDADYQHFLAGLAEFFATYKDALMQLACETASAQM
jgi:hypothetical protein